MKDLIKSKMFIAGFIVGIVFFFCVNILTAANICYHCTTRVGFPFVFHENNRTANLYEPVIDRFILFGLIADILAVLIFSFGIGLIFKSFVQKSDYCHLPLK